MVRNMKKIIMCLLLSALIGVALGIYSFTIFNKEEDIKVNAFKDVYAIQIGVFEALDNANKLASKYGAIIVNDNNRYRVYIAIVSDSLKEVEEYFDSKKIAYYVRNISVSDSFYNYLIDYEKLLKNVKSESYDVIIKNILIKYKEEL